MRLEDHAGTMAEVHALSVDEFVDERGRNHFREWFDRLDGSARSHVERRLRQIRLGNTSDSKGVGAGVIESRINTGPGFRLYYGRDGATLVILLGGGTKHRQEKDIVEAKRRWEEYKWRQQSAQSSDRES